jgi:hypothetical protein
LCDDDDNGGGVILSDIPLVRIEEENDALGDRVFWDCFSIIGRVIRVTKDELRLGGLIFIGVFFMTTVIPKICTDAP